MIFPVPPGVHPSTHRCGDCGGILLMPYRHELGGNALRCMNNGDHTTYQKKNRGTRWLFDGETGQLKEYDVMTQKPTTELAPITDTETALATVNAAASLGLFPGQQNPEQLALLARVALLYRLDPLMGELIPYQGRPYVTIAGRRRLDNAAGHFVSVSHRPPTADEEAYWLKVKAMDPQDVIQICVGTDMNTGMKVEGFGRVLAKERTGEGLTPAAKANLPTIQRSIEMAQKRAERRMREEMFGPVAKPEGIEVDLLGEGDEANIVESTGHVVEDKVLEQGDLGECSEHNVLWQVHENKFGNIQAYHQLGEDAFCQFGKVVGADFHIAYIVRFGEYKKAAADGWLKDNFNGRTWSKMEPRHMLEAIAKLQARPDVDTDTGEIGLPEDVDARNAELDAEIAKEAEANVE